LWRAGEIAPVQDPAQQIFQRAASHRPSDKGEVNVSKEVFDMLDTAEDITDETFTMQEVMELAVRHTSLHPHRTAMHAPQPRRSNDRARSKVYRCAGEITYSTAQSISAHSRHYSALHSRSPRTHAIIQHCTVDLRALTPLFSTAQPICAHSCRYTACLVPRFQRDLQFENWRMC
jgi:hypothetical protein